MGRLGRRRRSSCTRLSRAARLWIGAGTATLCFGWGPAGAESELIEQRIGELEFTQYCASCHGTRGRGDGPVAPYLSVAPPDLTRLRQRNGGIFPTRDVYDFIDGRRGPGVHGTREMPVWGDRYRAEALRGQPLPAGVNPEAIVHGRILTLVFYLQSIQVEQ